MVTASTLNSYVNTTLSLNQLSVGIQQTCCFYYAVADPGFPVGGRAPVVGAWTSDVGTFR